MTCSTLVPCMAWAPSLSNPSPVKIISVLGKSDQKERGRGPKLNVVTHFRMGEVNKDRSE